MKLQSRMLSLAVLATLPALAQAADDTTALDQILVTATRTPIALQDSIAPAQVIDRAQIESSQATSLQELLRGRAGINLMREQEYGRLIMVGSTSGLLGNVGQANYGAAKMALVGLMNTLVLEGKKFDIRVNCLAPAAATRMTEDLMPPEILDLLAPETVTPGLLYLVSEDSPNRTILAAGAGSFARVIVYETAGVHLPPAKLTPEGVAESWSSISDSEGQEEYVQGEQQPEKLLRRAAESRGLKLG